MLIDISLPWSAPQKCLVRRFPFSLKSIQIPLSPFSQNCHVFFCFRRQPKIPIETGWFTVSVQTQPVTPPIPRLQSAAGDDIHELVALGTERPVHNAPPRKPCLTKKVRQKILCPMKRMRKIERLVIPGNENPPRINFPSISLSLKPGRPHPNRKPIGGKGKSSFPSISWPRRFELETFEVFAEFNARNQAESAV